MSRPNVPADVPDATGASAPPGSASPQFGVLLLQAAPLTSMCHCCGWTGTGTTWDGSLGKSNSIPAFAACNPPQKPCTPTKPAQLLSPGSSNTIHPVWWAEGWSIVSVLRLSEVAGDTRGIGCSARMERWTLEQDRGPPVPQDPPRSPGSRGCSDHAGTRPLSPQHAADSRRIKLPQTPGHRSSPKIRHSASASLPTPVTGK